MSARNPFVGLTGGIGSGKSSVARRLAEHGALVVDADAIAREVVAPGTPGLDAVRERFGNDVIAADGSLNRPALGGLVFADEQARKDLEGITHPLIAERTAQLVIEAAPGQVIVHDIPLLVELQRQGDYDLVVIVDAPLEVRLERLQRDRGMSREEAESRIRSQASTEQRRGVADAWIDNDGDRAALDAAVDAVWEQRIAPSIAD